MNVASQADSGQWQFTSAKILLSTEHTWNKEEVAWSQNWLPYHLPEGYSGVTAYKDRDRTRAIERWGIPQDVDTERERTSISSIPLNSNIQLSISCSTLSLRDPFLPVLERIFNYDQISQISFFLYNAQSFQYFLFLLYESWLFTSKFDNYFCFKSDNLVSIHLLYMNHPKELQIWQE